MIESKTAPGIPRILTNIIVKKLRPILNPKRLPTKLKIIIINAPSTELSKSLIIAFKGTIKILQRTNKIQRPEIYVKTLISSIFLPFLSKGTKSRLKKVIIVFQTYSCNLISNMVCTSYEKTRDNRTKNQLTFSFFNSNSSSILTKSPSFFAFFNK